MNDDECQYMSDSVLSLELSSTSLIYPIYLELEASETILDQDYRELVADLDKFSKPELQRLCEMQDIKVPGVAWKHCCPPLGSNADMRDALIRRYRSIAFSGPSNVSACYS